MATTSRSSDDLRNAVRRELLAAALRDGDDGWVTFNELCRMLPPSVPRPCVDDALDFLKNLELVEETVLSVPQPRTAADDPRKPRRVIEARGLRLTRAALVTLLRDALTLSRSRGEGLLAALRQFEPKEMSR